MIGIEGVMIQEEKSTKRQKAYEFNYKINKY